MGRDIRKFIKMARFHNKRGLTLIELLLSVVLMGVIFLGTFALYNASQVFYFAANEKVITSYELQYAIDHIYKNVMTGIGDINNPAIVISAGNLEFTVRHIDTIDPDDSPTYAEYADDIELAYKIEDGELKFDSDGDGVFEESLAPKITVTGGSFSLDGNLLTVSLTVYYNDADSPLSFYSACYPRLASFQ